MTDYLQDRREALREHITTQRANLRARFEGELAQHKDHVDHAHAALAEAQDLVRRAESDLAAAQRAAAGGPIYRAALDQHQRVLGGLNHLQETIRRRVYASDAYRAYQKAMARVGEWQHDSSTRPKGNAASVMAMRRWQQELQSRQKDEQKAYKNLERWKRRNMRKLNNEVVSMQKEADQLAAKLDAAPDAPRDSDRRWADTARAVLDAASSEMDARQRAAIEAEHQFEAYRDIIYAQAQNEIVRLNEVLRRINDMDEERIDIELARLGLGSHQPPLRQQGVSVPSSKRTTRSNIRLFNGNPYLDDDDDPGTRPMPRAR